MQEFSQRWTELGPVGQRLMLLGLGCAVLGFLLRFAAARIFSAGLGNLLMCGSAAVLALTWCPPLAVPWVGGLLALAMLLAAFVADRQVEAETETTRARTRSVSADVFRHCAALLAFGVVCHGLLQSPVTPAQDLALPIGLALVAIAALLSRSDHGSVALFGAAGLIAILGHRLRESTGGALSIVGILASVVAVALPIMTSLRNWRLRRACWLDDPRRLLASPDAPGWREGVVIGCGALVVFAAAAAQDRAFTPLWVFLAALGVLGVAHATRQRAVGELGLLLAAGAWASAGTAWIPAGDWRLPIGAATGAWFLFWAGRFWSQQLLDGGAWTTTGALVLPALRLARILAPASAAITVATALQIRPDDARIVFPMPIVFLAHLLLLVGSSKSARQNGAASGAFAAGAAAIGFAATLAEGARRWLPAVETELAWGGALALAAGLYWWLTESAHARAGYQAARVSFAVGLVPILLLVLCVGSRVAWSWDWTTGGLLAGAALLPIVLLTASSRTLAGRL